MVRFGPEARMPAMANAGTLTIKKERFVSAEKMQGRIAQKKERGFPMEEFMWVRIQLSRIQGFMMQ